jgi:LPXTG-motif cell wall-anchored protein
MAMVLVVIAGVCLTASFLLSQGETNGELAGNLGLIGIIVAIVGLLFHMRKRRNEQLEAMRGRGNDNSSGQNG